MKKMKIKILEENATIICIKGNVYITEFRGESHGCETCGYIDPFQPIVSDGGTWWCLNCAEANGEKISKEDLNKIEAECKKREKDYIEKRYKELH